MNSSPVFAQASWIASPIAGGKRTSAPAPYVRKSFRLDQPVRSAQLVVTALHFGLVDESVRATTARELVRDIEKRKYHLATGFVGTPYLLEVLESARYLDVAYKLLEQETFPSWLFPVRNGATTIWERWDGWTPEKGFQDKGMNSFNHYAYGAVGAWMYRTVAGLELDPAVPRYAHIIFRPRPGGSITWAEAALQTSFGPAGIRWDLNGDTLQVQLTVPAGARDLPAAVRLCRQRIQLRRGESSGRA